ncbi:Alpha-ionylideneethane synthase abl3 [Mycena venus]|uniref:Alpha-ionylideneethane synthase abl3 n=1 Tax=Mycena venus TaxID=2733690 RepID=A0A8H6Y0C5_9AGAR|nr:Alpha-ionylideneethane synthase abl3 [Mycena venus]
MHQPTTNGNMKTTASSQGCDTWYYPPDIANDLKDVNLPHEVKCEIFACAWEYARCVIPQYTNWDRYVAFMRIIVMGTIAEFKGSMVDVTAGDMILGYSLSSTLATLFEGTPCHADMAREYRTFLLITADKASNRRDSELFRRYVNSLAQSPRQWFRMRDCDALARFTIAAALACNDLDDAWLSEEQFNMLGEIGITLYDAVAFYKHRSEGETNSTFAYMPDDLRVRAFRQCREVLWALDVAWARQRQMRAVINFLRFFGGPIHMMMRRYRFVEEGLTIGKPETNQVITQTRANFKLWNRVSTPTR